MGLRIANDPRGGPSAEGRLVAKNKIRLKNQERTAHLIEVFIEQIREKRPESPYSYARGFSKGSELAQ